jgi:hypothetical protein
MSTEYGLFSDEGCVEAGFTSWIHAHLFLQCYSEEDDLEVLEICPDHEGQPKDFCEECGREEIT